MTVLYATDESGLWMYELSRAVLARQVPDANVVLFTDFDGSSDDATVVNVSKYLADAGLAERWRPGLYRFPLMSAARLVAPLVPETRGLDRVLYLDVDTLVLDGASVPELYGTEFGPESDCAGCRDDVQPLFLSHDNKRLVKLMNSVLESHALDGHDETLVKNIMKGFYINTGVVLYNMARLVQDYEPVLAAARSVLDKHRFRFFDQDVTNMLLLTQEVPGRFNDLVAGNGCVAKPGSVIAHYAGGKTAKEAFRRDALRMLR